MELGGHVTIDADSSAREAAAHPEVPERAWVRPERLGAAGRGLLSSLALVLGLALATRAVAAAKDLLVAYRFGISNELDAFILASLIPTSILYAFAASAGDAFLPIYVTERRRVGEAAARRFLATTTWISTISLLGVAVILGLAAPWTVGLLAVGFDRTTADLTLLFYVGLLPTLITGGLSAVWPAALNVHARQAVTAAVPLLTPLTTLAALVLLAPRLGAAALVAGAVGGAAAEAVILGTVLARMRSPVVPRRPRRDPATARFARNVVPLTAAALISLGSGLVDQGMAASLGSGAVSSFSYATKIFVFLTGTAGIALTMVVLPRFAELVSEATARSLRSDYLRSLGVALGAGVVLAAMLAIGSREIVGLLFQRGSFDPSATAVVAPIQAIIALQLPFALGNLLTVRLLLAVGNPGAIVVTTIFNLALHAAGNLILMPILGVAGIALSGTISAAVLFIVLTVWALRSLAGGVTPRSSE